MTRQSPSIATGSRSKRASIAALAILIAIYLYTAVMSFVQPVAL
jgi:hypothetical protein